MITLVIPEYNTAAWLEGMDTQHILQLQGFRICRSPNYLILHVHLNQAENITKKWNITISVKIIFQLWQLLIWMQWSRLILIIQLHFKILSKFQMSWPRLEPGTSQSLSECANLYTNETSLLVVVLWFQNIIMPTQVKPSLSQVKAQCWSGCKTDFASWCTCQTFELMNNKVWEQSSAVFFTVGTVAKPTC